MNSLIHLAWEKNRTGYEVVDFDRSKVDWSALTDGVPADSIAPNLSVAALQALDEWEHQLAPNNWDPDNHIQLIVPIDRSPIPYSLAQGLFIAFANTEPTPAGVLAFANEHGLLWRDQPDRVEAWYFRIAQLRNAVDTWSKVGDDNPEAFKKLYDDFFEDNPVFVDRIRPTLEPSATKGLQFAFEVNDLLSTMWLQLGLAVAGVSRFIQCSECSNFIEIGRDTGRRHKSVCSNRCRVRHHRRLKGVAASDPTEACLEENSTSPAIK